MNTSEFQNELEKMGKLFNLFEHAKDIAGVLSNHDQVKKEMIADIEASKKEVEMLKNDIDASKAELKKIKDKGAEIIEQAHMSALKIGNDIQDAINVATKKADAEIAEATKTRDALIDKNKELVDLNAALEKANADLAAKLEKQKTSLTSVLSSLS